MLLCFDVGPAVNTRRDDDVGGVECDSGLHQIEVMPCGLRPVNDFRM